MASSDAGPGGPPPPEPAVPPAVLRSWDEAEARLFPLVMAQPELYEQALGALRQLLGRLRETCRDLPALLAAHERGGDLLAGDEVPGVRPGLIAAAACATRYRELVAELAAALAIISSQLPDWPARVKALPPSATTAIFVMASCWRGVQW